MRLAPLLLAVVVLSITAPALAVPADTSTQTAASNQTETQTPVEPAVTPETDEYTPVPSPTPEPTATPAEPTPRASDRGKPNGRNIELSPVTSISRYWYTDGYFIVELRSKIATDVTVVESLGKRGSGAHRLNKRTVPISPGRSLVRLEAPAIGGEASATITTQQADYVIGLRSSSGFDLLDGPYQGNAVAAAGGAGLLISGIVLPVGITIIRSRRNGGRLL
jgi:hypothetical protein